MGLVLGGDADAADAGIDGVGKRKIDDARLAAEIDRRLGAAFGELRKPVAAAAGENIRHRVARQRLPTPIDHLLPSLPR